MSDNMITNILAAIGAAAWLPPVISLYHNWRKSPQIFGINNGKRKCNTKSISNLSK